MNDDFDNDNDDKEALALAEAAQAAYAAEVKASVTKQADVLGDIARRLKVDEVIASTRETMLEESLQLMTQTAGFFVKIAEEYMGHYLESHPRTERDVLNLAALVHRLEQLNLGCVVIARWNALHPDQKSIGNVDFMAHLNTVVAGSGQ